MTEQQFEGTTPRGFGYTAFDFRPYADAEPERFSVQVSSLASERKVWIGVNDDRAHLNEDEARRVRDALDAFLAERPPSEPDDEDTDDEEFCARCYAGVDSSEHHERCVVTGHADDGESAPDPSSHPPTREQIADELEYRVRTAVSRARTAEKHGEPYPREFVDQQIADGRARVLALIQNGADR